MVYNIGIKVFESKKDFCNVDDVLLNGVTTSNAFQGVSGCKWFWIVPYGSRIRKRPKFSSGQIIADMLTMIIAVLLFSIIIMYM